MLTAAAIEGYRQYTERIIHHAGYRIGSTWHDTPVTRKARMAGGKVAVYFSVSPGTASSATVNAVRLYDAAGNVWAEKTETIVISSVQEGILYRVTFDLHEEEAA